MRMITPLSGDIGVIFSSDVKCFILYNVHSVSCRYSLFGQTVRRFIEGKTGSDNEIIPAVFLYYP